MLCLGITPDDHEWLQAHSDDVEVVAAYLHEHEIACALAHPFFAVAAPLTARHRRRLAELFDIWEVRNGARDAELNLPAAVYVETHGGIGIGGTDDHAGIDIGRTYSETPPRRDAGRSSSHTCAPVACRRTAITAAPPAGRTTRWRWRCGRSATARPARRPTRRGVADRRARDERVRGRAANRVRCRRADLGPDDARALLRAWLAAVELDLPDGDLIAYLQADGFSHADLQRRARRSHERKLARRGRQADRGRRLVRGPAGGRAGRPARRGARAVRGLRAGDPLRARRGVPRAREAAAVGARQRAGARRAGRRRRRQHARRHAHARRDPRARRAGLRGRGDRQRPARRPPAAGGRGGRDPVLPGPARRRARGTRGRRRAGRGPLRAAARLRARPRRRGGRPDGPHARAAARRLLPHRADRVRAAALRRPAHRARRCSSR